MAVPRVLCIVLAGGRGSRLGPLTTGRAKPALPVGGNYRLIDVALSNAAHSGLIDVWVLEQYEPHLLNEHLSGGRPWDLDRTRGGFRTLPPFEGTGPDGFADGNADALARNWGVIDAFDPEVLLVCSADHLLAIDLREVVATHLDSDADATVVGTSMPTRSDLSRYLVVQAEGGAVTSLDYKPDKPQGRYVGTEVFAYKPGALRDCLRDLRAEGGELGDYGERLLPRMLETGTVADHEYRGHWRDLGTPQSYLDGQLDLLKDRPPMVMDDPAWPMLTSMPQRSPARVRRGAELERTWLSPGSDIAGSVVDSVIGPGVRIEKGAVVRHSVIMNDAVIRSGATVSRSVVSDFAVIGKDAHLGADNAKDPVLVGARRRISAGTRLAAGTAVDAVESRNLFDSTR
jgi:glucose-1-phosphate adenylyltransferase